MELETLKDLYIHELKDLFSAERQLVKALPKMAKAANNKELAAGFQEHLSKPKNTLNVLNRFCPVTRRALGERNARAWKALLPKVLR
jgi:ferritin-like metal-binding protein YciE